MASSTPLLVACVFQSSFPLFLSSKEDRFGLTSRNETGVPHGIGASVCTCLVYFVFKVLVSLGVVVANFVGQSLFLETLLRGAFHFFFFF